MIDLREWWQAAAPYMDIQPAMTVPGTQNGAYQQPHWGSPKVDAPAKSPERVQAEKSLGKAIRITDWKPTA